MASLIHNNMNGEQHRQSTSLIHNAGGSIAASSHGVHDDFSAFGAADESDEDYSEVEEDDDDDDDIDDEVTLHRRCVERSSGRSSGRSIEHSANYPVAD